MSDTHNHGSPAPQAQDELQPFPPSGRQCTMGIIENYDPAIEARADELEALLCLAYLLRTDVEQPDRVNGYLDQVDSVLDRMVNKLKECA